MLLTTSAHKKLFCKLICNNKEGKTSNKINKQYEIRQKINK